MGGRESKACWNLEGGKGNERETTNTLNNLQQVLATWNPCIQMALPMPITARRRSEQQGDVLRLGSCKLHLSHYCFSLFPPQLHHERNISRHWGQGEGARSSEGAALSFLAREQT